MTQTENRSNLPIFQFSQLVFSLTLLSDVLKNDSSRISRLTRGLTEDTLTEISNHICGKFGKETEEFTECLDDLYFTFLIDGIESGKVHDRLSHWAGESMQKLNELVFNFNQLQRLHSTF